MNARSPAVCHGAAGTAPTPPVQHPAPECDFDWVRAEARAARLEGQNVALALRAA